MPEHRPHVHLRPEQGWTNDPTGPIRWRERTHLFHQYNPDGGYWDRPHWGHLVSDDLVRWRRRPIALSPTPGGPDAEGCFSGCVVIDGDEAVMAYTGVVGPNVQGQPQVTCLARSCDALLDHWVKDPANPVTTGPDDRRLLGFRDPFLWQDDDGRWWQAVGAGSREAGGVVLLYSSRDLHRWEAHGPLLAKADLDALDPTVWTGSMWECPVLLRGRDGDALLLSIHGVVDTHYPLAVIGRLDGERFVASHLQRLDLGPDLYAPCLLQEADGTAISWGWSWEARTPEVQRDTGWAGVLSAPRRLEVVDGRLHVAPLAELAQLRGRQLDVRPTPTPRGWTAAGIDADVADLELTLGPAVDRIDLELRRSPDGEEVTTLTLDRARGEVWLDRDHASRDPAARGGRYGGSPDPATPIDRVRILLDRSIVEVFVDDRVALTARIYPTREDSTGVAVVGTPSSVADVELRAWNLTSIWTDEEHPVREQAATPFEDH
ncbi:MAG: glycoside hydrolase family 32 protein [Nitriliruptoraceae bacterium]